VAAGQALGLIGDRRATEPLTALLGSPYRVVRLVAAYSLLNLGVITLEGEQGKQLEKAKAEYVQALRNWPDVPEFRINLGVYKQFHGNHAEALEEFKIAVSLNPTLPDGYFGLGRAHAYLGQFREALTAFRKVREIQPGRPGLDQLIEAAEKALKQQP
jgi:tetratricopeptide (TPR) repeat protein